MKKAFENFRPSAQFLALAGISHCPFIRIVSFAVLPEAQQKPFVPVRCGQWSG